MDGQNLSGHKTERSDAKQDTAWELQQQEPLTCLFFFLLEQIFISYSGDTCFTFSIAGPYLQIPENIPHFTEFDCWKERFFSLFHPLFLELSAFRRMHFYHLVFIQMEISLQRQLKWSFSLLPKCCWGIKVMSGKRLEQRHEVEGPLQGNHGQPYFLF